MYLTSWSHICVLPRFPEGMGSGFPLKPNRILTFLGRAPELFLNLNLRRCCEMGLQAQPICSTSCLCENKWDGSNASYQLDRINFLIPIGGQRKKCVLFIQLLFHADRYLEFQQCDRAICVKTLFCPCKSWCNSRSTCIS